MSNADNEIIVTKTKSWITNVVVACYFCPFAAREIKRGSIHYEVINDANSKTVLDATLKMFLLLNNNEQIETSILILPDHFSEFNDYLDLVEKA